MEFKNQAMNGPFESISLEITGFEKVISSNHAQFTIIQGAFCIFMITEVYFFINIIMHKVSFW